LVNLDAQGTECTAQPDPASARRLPPS
jgi:hypothetical protein